MSCRYRENPPSKCFMEYKGRLPGPTSLDSRRWRFVRTGQDDFRRGCLPCDGLTALGPREGFLPQIDHRAPQPAPKKRLPRHAALCSKLSPAQQARKAFLADIEAQLTLHPLALYPDLEEDMPTEGSLNIDEEFILRQFDINYQSKPCYNVLHTMRPSQVPLELKKRSGLNKLQEPQFFQKLDCEQRLRKPQKPHKPKWVKMRYGAWYLNPKLWKKQRADEPLVDPKVLCKAQDENFEKELQKQEELLADLHGTVAFKDFILSRGYRMPSFLEKMYMKKECKRECNQSPIK
ncbi:hypothetical protein G4228_004364 [Cervus hanglu yarkandensis]|nr:hypothetical protein G4228_004364 [Cervus hanglu yarkandensis]